MEPFRNSGWEYYDMVQAITPDGTSGQYAFSSSSVAPFSPVLKLGNDVLQGSQMEGNYGVVTGIPMDADRGGAGPLSSSRSASRRKCSALDDWDLKVFQHSASQSSTSLAAHDSNDLSISPLSASPAISSPGSPVPPFIGSFLPETVNVSDDRALAMIQLATAIENINIRLDKEVVRLIRTRDDGLTVAQKVKLIGILTEKGLMNAYLGFDDDEEMRCRWISDLWHQ